MSTDPKQGLAGFPIDRTDEWEDRMDRERQKSAEPGAGQGGDTPPMPSCNVCGETMERAFKCPKCDNTTGCTSAESRQGAEPPAIAQELIAARTAWLEDFGVPISAEFARFAKAIGKAVDFLQARAATPTQGADPPNELANRITNDLNDRAWLNLSDPSELDCVCELVRGHISGAATPAYRQGLEDAAKQCMKWDGGAFFHDAILALTAPRSEGKAKPNHDVPPPNTFAPNEPMRDVFRSRTELVGTLNRYRENLRWYVEERNRLIEELNAFKREQQARLDLKQTGKSTENEQGARNV